MQSKLHKNVVYHGVEVLLLVSMPFLLAIPKSLLTLKEFLYTSFTQCGPQGFQSIDHLYTDVMKLHDVVQRQKCWQKLFQAMFVEQFSGSLTLWWSAHDLC